MSDPENDDWNDLHDPSQYDGRFNDPCHLCHGTGEINALTDQDLIFVASYADCPECDGSGCAS